MRKFACLLVALLLSGCGTASAGANGFVAGDGTLTVLPADQRPAAPVIEGTTLAGDAWRSDATSGKVLVYNVWGSWCAPCRAEAPVLVAASKRTAETAVFLNTRDLDKAAPQAFIRAFAVPYVNLYDPDGALLLKFSGQLPASAIPSTLLVDPKGRVAARIIGEVTETTLVDVISDLAAGK